MTTETGQASGQSSSNSGSQQQSAASSGGQGAASDQGQQTQNSGGQQQAAPQRPAYIPENFWDGEKNEVKGDAFASHLNDLTAFKSEADVRKQGLPPSADKYEIKLPAEFKPPEGMAFEFKADDPSLKAFRDIAHKRGLDQETFSEALGAFAAVKIAEHQQVATGREAEMGKLGATAQARIDAVANWLTAKVGDKANILVQTLKQYPVAANVEALEGVIRAFSSQGGSGFNQSHRETAQDEGKIPGYDKMTFEQKRLAQEQQRLRRTA